MTCVIFGHKCKKLGNVCTWMFWGYVNSIPALFGRSIAFFFAFLPTTCKKKQISSKLFEFAALSRIFHPIRAFEIKKNVCLFVPISLDPEGRCIMKAAEILSVGII